MNRYSPLLLISITQIKTMFSDSIGNIRQGFGTGFFIRRLNQILFVTNKHNLDPMFRGIGADYSLFKVEIRLRQHNGNSFMPESRFVQIDLQTIKLVHSKTADVSIIVEPQFIGRGPLEKVCSINADDLADASFFQEKVEIMDHASFLGFPGTSSSSWWDTKWNLPIARTVSIASIPHIPFSNKSIPSDDVTLVSGLSFSGSSGSLVLLHQKSFPPGDIIDPWYTPAKIIGLMSGHFKEPSDESEMFRHSGLSYYTRSTAILELFNNIM